MYSEEIEKLIKKFSDFPGVGPKTAARFVFYLTDLSKKETKDFLKAVAEVKNSLKRCNFCFKYFNFSSQKNKKLCEVCSDPGRDKNKICVVEKETDLASIEEKNLYKGLYFVLGGSVSSLEKKDLRKLRIEELKERIKTPGKFGVQGEIKEVILALNPTTEGEGTTLLLQRKLKELPVTLTRLGRGLPRGGEVEYADRETLSSAFKNRS